MQVDVLVIGSEPEAITAAVAAAEEGASTVLLSTDARLGGLFVLGELNVLDLKTQPELTSRGLFERWWDRVGRRPAFDVQAAEAAFAAMLDEAGVTVILGAHVPVPLVDQHGRVLGARAGGRTVLASQIIDGGGDASFAAAAGAPFSIGWNALGVDQRMADTLVFRIRGVDWNALVAEVKRRGGGFANVRDNVVWGHFGGSPAAYQSELPGLRLRGLNLGRQDDGSILVNALLVYGDDAVDLSSRHEAHARATAEAPDVVRYLASNVPGLAGARFAGVADALYVRESRHLQAQCVLSVDDVLDNRVTTADVAAGGYPLDVQSMTPYDSGFVFGAPSVYGARLCMAVPPSVPPLWVVGRSAGFLPIAFSSARVVPFGMAFAEAVGVAAAMAARNHVEPASLAVDPDAVAAVRARLAQRGAYLPSVAPRIPVGPIDDPYYEDYRLLLSRGLAVGGYDNDPHLELPNTRLSFLYLLSNVAQRFFHDDATGPGLVARFGTETTPLQAADALEIVYQAACDLGTCPAAETWSALRAAGLAPASFPPSGPFTRGEAYALAARVARQAPGTIRGSGG